MDIHLVELLARQRVALRAVMMVAKMVVKDLKMVDQMGPRLAYC